MPEWPGESGLAGTYTGAGEEFPRKLLRSGFGALPTHESEGGQSLAPSVPWLREHFEICGHQISELEIPLETTEHPYPTPRYG